MQALQDSTTKGGERASQAVERKLAAKERSILLHRKVAHDRWIGVMIGI
jgi:hypothetical protein